MSGHSKWHNIRVKKMASDAKRGKTYTKYARLIEIAAREGGGDATSNVRLRTLIDSAKAESVPNANIDRAIKKGTGELKGAAQMEEITYEAYGPASIALIIECLSDNRNRTLSNVKMIVAKNGGRFAESGSVLWMFDRKGVIIAKTPDNSEGRDAPLGRPGTDQNSDHSSIENLELELIDFGAEDFSEQGGHLRVVTSMNDWTKIRDFLKGKGCEIMSAGLQYVPKQTVPADDAAMEKLHVLMDALEEDDDVSEVHSNAV